MLYLQVFIIRQAVAAIMALTLWDHIFFF